MTTAVLAPPRADGDRALLKALGLLGPGRRRVVRVPGALPAAMAITAEYLPSPGAKSSTTWC